jgi:hypothetical protein
MAQFENLFTGTFGGSNRERMAKTKMQGLRQGSQSIAIYAVEFE